MNIEDERRAGRFNPFCQGTCVIQAIHHSAAAVGIDEQAQSEAVPAMARKDGDGVAGLAVVAENRAALLGLRQRGNIGPKRNGEGWVADWAKTWVAGLAAKSAIPAKIRIVCLIDLGSC